MKNQPGSTLVMLPIVFFIGIPALFVKQNIQDIAGLEAAVLIALAILTAGSMCLLFGLRAFLQDGPLSSLMGKLVQFAYFWFIATGFVFPASVSIGMLDPEQIPVNHTNLILAFLLAGGLSWLASTAHSKALSAGLILFVGLNTTLSMTAMVGKFTHSAATSGPPGQQSLFEASFGKNLFVLSFDGISGSAVEEILRSDEPLARQFDSFVLFTGVASSSPATSASTATSLYGNRDFKSQYPTEERLWAFKPEALLTNYLNDNGYRVSTYGVYNTQFVARERQHTPTAANGTGLADIINYTIARTLTWVFVLPKQIFEKFQFWITGHMPQEDTRAGQFMSKIARSQAPGWKRYLTPGYLDAKAYIENLQPAHPGPVAHFIHFTFTHYPVEFDRDCNYRGDDEAWFEAHQDRPGVVAETRCALSMFVDFLDRLKALNLFDQSLVVLKSDHGKPVSYYPAGSLESRQINHHEYWGYGRYEPVLAIKGFQSQAAKLVFNPAPVMLDDLALTICTAALSHHPCSSYPGYDLLDENLNIPASATATLFVVRSDRSTFRYDTHHAVTVKRQPDILQNLYEELTRTPH